MFVQVSGYNRDASVSDSEFAYLGGSARLALLAIQKGTRVLISLWGSLMFGRVPGTLASPIARQVLGYHFVLREGGAVAGHDRLGVHLLERPAAP